MGHALVQHLASLLVFALACASCVGAKGNDRHELPQPPEKVGYVSPTGVDTADGSQAAPLRSIQKALAGDFDRIVLLRGAHDEDRIEIRKPVTIEGDGPVVVRGHVFVSASGVTLKGISFGGGIRANFVEDLKIETATIAPGSKDDTLEVTRASASLSRVKLTCGAMSCVQATTATVTIERSIAIGASDTKRIMRFDVSRARVARSRLEKGSVAQLQIGGGSEVEAEDLVLSGGSNGIVAAQGSKLSAKKVVVEGATKMSLVGQRTKLRIDDSTFGATLDQTVGLSGADAVFRRTIIEGSPKGAVSIVDHIVGKSVVRFEEGEIRHGAATGILLGSGMVTIAGVRFTGSKPKKGDGNDAITAHGVDSRVVIESATIETPGGFGVAFHADASGSVTATISNPELGGVLIEEAAAEPIVISGAVISGCGKGSGIVVQDGAKVTVEKVRVEGCKEAGVLAGAKSSVQITDSSFASNAMYGCAAFGGATIEVSGTKIRGSKFATFASCGDGARVEDKGGNRFEGTVSACP